MDVAAIRAGLAAAVGAVPGLNSHAYVPGSPTAPVAVVGPPTVTYDPSLRAGAAQVELDLWVAVAHTSDRHTQAKVDAYMSTVGDLSVWAAIQADRTLGGTVADVRLERAEPVDLTVDGGITFMAVQFTLTALTAGA